MEHTYTIEAHQLRFSSKRYARYATVYLRLLPYAFIQAMNGLAFSFYGSKW